MSEDQEKKRRQGQHSINSRFPKSQKLLGKEVFRRRRELGLTQGKLAQKLGRSTATVSKLETGQRSFDVDLLLAVSEALDISPVLLLSKAHGSLIGRDRLRDSLIQVLHTLVAVPVNSDEGRTL